MALVTSDDARYLGMIIECVRVCASYKPRFGRGKKEGVSLQKFQDMYRGDPFYSWLGLDNPMMYAAHKAAGGMTSVYRQIGIGCERVFQQAVRDALGLSDDDVAWSYEITTPDGKTRKPSLDVRVPVKGIPDEPAKERFYDWIQAAAHSVGLEQGVLNSLNRDSF